MLLFLAIWIVLGLAAALVLGRMVRVADEQADPWNTAKDRLVEETSLLG